LKSAVQVKSAAHGAAEDVEDEAKEHKAGLYTGGAAAAAACDIMLATDVLCGGAASSWQTVTVTSDVVDVRLGRDPLLRGLS
jgi:hypothetical protein